MLSTLKNIASAVSEFIFLLTYSWFAEEVEEDEHWLPYLKLGYWEGVEPILEIDYRQQERTYPYFKLCDGYVQVDYRPENLELPDYLIWEAEEVVFGDVDCICPEEFDAVDLFNEAKELLEGEELNNAINSIVRALAEFYHGLQLLSQPADDCIPF